MSMEDEMDRVIRLSRRLNGPSGRVGVMFWMKSLHLWVAALASYEHDDVVLTGDQAEGADPQHALEQLIEAMRADLTDKMNEALGAAERYKAALEGSDDD